MRMRKDVICQRVKQAAEVGNVRAPGPCPFCGKRVKSFVESVEPNGFSMDYFIQHHCPVCNGLWTEFCHDDAELPVIAVLYALRRGMHHAVA